MKTRLQSQAVIIVGVGLWFFFVTTGNHENGGGYFTVVAENDPDPVCLDDVCQQYEEFQLPMLPNFSMRLLQQSSFTYSEEHPEQGDDTGAVVWGASVCLGRFLAQNFASLTPVVQAQNDNNNDNSNKNRKLTILELGCGSGIPSLVACYLAQHQHQSMRVIASDQREENLQLLQHVASLNNCSQLEVQQLNWDDNPGENVLQADILLASEVIYSHESVPPLVRAIDKYLSHTPGSTAYIALRSGRPGVHVFRQWAMPEAGFIVRDKLLCRPYQEDYFDAPPKPDNEDWLPPGFQNEGGRNRWKGHNTILVIERKPAENNGDNNNNAG